MTDVPLYGNFIEGDVNHNLRNLYSHEKSTFLPTNLNDPRNQMALIIDSSFVWKSFRSKSISDDDEDKNVDIFGCTKKPIEEWEESDTIIWLLKVGLKLGHTYSRMSPNLAVTGQKLLQLTIQDFIHSDQLFGEKLYRLLHREYDSTNFHGESVYELELVQNQLAKRPPLWMFLLQMLLNPEYCPTWIRWEDYEQRTFRFVKNHEIAKLWGTLNGNENMSYPYFTRLIRYKYERDPDGRVNDNGFLAPTSSRLVYKFGKKATGLETDNPNFEKLCITN